MIELQSNNNSIEIQDEIDREYGWINDLYPPEKGFRAMGIEKLDGKLRTKSLETARIMHYKGIPFIAYNYRSKSNELFMTNGATLEQCREERKKYFKKEKK